MKKLILTLLMILTPTLAVANVADQITPQPPISTGISGPATWQLTVWRQASRAGGLTTLPASMTFEACEAAAESFVASSIGSPYYGLEAYCTDAHTGEVVFFPKTK